MKCLALIICLMVTPVWAVEPDEVLDNPALEARARAISTQVRCVVCQNEPIDSSNSSVARDLRLIIRERLVAGDTDRQIYDFLVRRYGDFVLFNPPWKSTTYALWLGPIVFLLCGLLAVALTLRSRRSAAPTNLSSDEQVALDAMLKTRVDK